MPYIAPEIILEAKRMDLLTYLRNFEPNELVKLSDRVYTTRRHDSLKISNGKWMWWSQGIGGKSALDYLVKVKGLRFVDAVETIMVHTAIQGPIYTKNNKSKPLLLPDKSASIDKVYEYLSGRGIDYEIITYCVENNLIFESLPYHNIVFVGYDEEKIPRYAAFRSTKSDRIMGDCSGSKKQFSFRIARGSGNEIHLFECAIDLLSYATICKYGGKNWQEMNLVSLAGVYSPRKKIEDSKVPVVLENFLKAHEKINRVILHFDNDRAGRYAAKALKIILSEEYEVVDNPPPKGKDFNDFLCIKMGINRKTKGELNYE